ncbi:MAG TPA: helix-turn-helix transcriptional regulator [Polyangiaceae bacterium]|jgi:DNA-binding NarL/FixJ family response regulator|nr:helix-turn-helix transcriptional regulator [Polyangiaceae bacterium]
MLTSQHVFEWEPSLDEFTLDGFLDGSFRLVELVRDDAVCRAVLKRERPPGKLSARERCVIERLIGGSSQKTVSFDLGVALTTVSVHLRVALDKLGIRLWEHAVLAGAIIQSGDAMDSDSSDSEPTERLAVVKVELARTALAQLTDAEREVALLVVDGLTNAEIGVQRNTSPRTVANQVAAVFRKLGVHGRLELIRKLSLAAPNVAERLDSSIPPRLESAPPAPRPFADVAALPIIPHTPPWPELSPV